MRIPFADDLHSHLRQGELMNNVVKHIRSGGCNRVLVMPNTKPNIASCKQALEYRNSLLAIEPNVDYLMTLYLSDNISIDDLKENAKNSHVQGIKCYPAGVTTNSEEGFHSLEHYYPLFSEMEKLNLSLHIHGESVNCNPLIAEDDFLINIEKVCRSFPNLKVVAEHVSTESSIEAVYRIHNLGATITPQHMILTTSDVLSSLDIDGLKDITKKIKDPYAYCKPIAKSTKDKGAILQAIKSKHPRIFLGSDSAPHLITSKESNEPPAGIFTQPYLICYLAEIFDSISSLEFLKDFTSKNGAEFLQLQPKENEYVFIEEKSFKVINSFY